MHRGADRARSVTNGGVTNGGVTNGGVTNGGVTKAGIVSVINLRVQTGRTTREPG